MRKHVKTVHGADAYANKKHKGNNVNGNGPGQADGGGGGMSATSSPPSSFDVTSEQRTSSTPISPASSGTPPSSDDATKSPPSKPSDGRPTDDSSGGGGGVVGNGQQHDLSGPISDDLVTSTCVGSVEPASDWYVTESVNMASPDPADLIRPGPFAITVGGAGDDVGGSSPSAPPNIALKGGRSSTPSFRARLKSGFKTAANWIPNMFNAGSKASAAGIADNRRPQEAAKNSKNKKEQKPLLVRQNSTASNSNHSYYSSVLGSDGNSFGSNGGGPTQASCFEMKPLSVSQAGGLNRCASYDPISLGGSSRRSSSTSLASSAAASGPTTRTTKRASARHLSQTDNLVIVGQQCASLSSDGYGSSISTLDSAAGSFTGPLSDSGSNSTTMTVATQVSAIDASSATRWQEPWRARNYNLDAPKMMQSMPVNSGRRAARRAR